MKDLRQIIDEALDAKADQWYIYNDLEETTTILQHNLVDIVVKAVQQWLRTVDHEA